MIATAISGDKKSYVAPQAQVYGIELQGTALSATVNARQADMADRLDNERMEEMEHVS